MNIITEWFPWLNLLSDFYMLQLFICYTVYLLFFSKNVYYVLIYFFILMFYFGIMLGIYQLELFTGFLWLIECVVIFISLLLVLFIQTTGSWNNLFLSSYLYIYSSCLFGVIYIIFNFFYPYIDSPLDLFNDIFYWDDFYEASLNSNVNDFIGFLISYYTVNNFFLLTVIFLILIASIICVNLNKIMKTNRIQNFTELFSIFNFFKNNVEFIFMRQQNLVDQESSLSSTRIFKKKTTL